MRDRQYRDNSGTEGRAYATDSHEKTLEKGNTILCMCWEPSFILREHCNPSGCDLLEEPLKTVLCVCPPVLFCQLNVGLN